MKCLVTLCCPVKPGPIDSRWGALSLNRLLVPVLTYNWGRDDVLAAIRLSILMCFRGRHTISTLHGFAKFSEYPIENSESISMFTSIEIMILLLKVSIIFFASEASSWFIRMWSTWTKKSQWNSLYPVIGKVLDRLMTVRFYTKSKSYTICGYIFRVARINLI